MGLENLAAGQPEIIRSQQKDEYVKSILKNDLAAVVVALFGPKTLIKYEEEIASLSRLCYVYFTTAFGLQTIGEEYCHLLQVDAVKFRIPSKKSHYLMILLQVLAPFLIQRILRRLQKVSLNSTSDEEWSYQLLSPDSFQAILTVFSRFHLAIFYINGKFYEISKRLTGIRYVVIRDFLTDSFARSQYSILGKLLFIQVAVFLIQKVTKIMPLIYGTLTKRNAVRKRQPKDQIRKNKTRVKCPLCLSPATDITATPCGHLFCWYCIIDWSKRHLECPVCRNEVNQSTLIYLCQFNF